MTDARLIIDSPATGAWNMAMDQSLLQTANDQGQVTLRFYQWSEPTLSLGYFQKAADRESHAASLACPLVRRTSGGGAILHDQELTYSICVPAANRWSRASDQLYSLVHKAIIRVLAEHRIDTKQVTGSSHSSPGNRSFLCFQRHTDGDLLVAGNKVCGSAQRRLQNAMIQHGSLLLTASACAPELPGITNLTGVTPCMSDLAGTLAQQFAIDLNLSIEPATAESFEIESATEICEQRFLDAAWTLRR